MTQVCLYQSTIRHHHDVDDILGPALTSDDPENSSLRYVPDESLSLMSIPPIQEVVMATLWGGKMVVWNEAEMEEAVKEVKSL